MFVRRKLIDLLIEMEINNNIEIKMLMFDQCLIDWLIDGCIGHIDYLDK